MKRRHSGRAWLWLAITAAGAAVIAATLSPRAAADGDPASDSLLGLNVFFPYEAPSTAARIDLEQAVAGVYQHGDRLKVAVIYSRDDLGSIPSLFDRPGDYAQFLGTELGYWYIGPLLVAMPSGFGIYDGGRSTAAEQSILAAVPISGASPDDLVKSAADAVLRMSAAGRLTSPDIRAPLVTPYPAKAARGKTARLHFDVFDDSGRTKATVRVYERTSLLATIVARTIYQTGTRHVTVTWDVPRKLASNQLRFCVVATDPAGNSSRPACASFLRVS